MNTNRATIETAELFRDLINKSNDAVFVADPSTGLFIFVNDKACASLGYERGDLLKMGVTDIEAKLPDDFSWQTHVNELRQKGSLIFEGIHKRKNGATFPIEANISYVKLEERAYLVTVVRDITERRKMEEALFSSEERFRRLFQDSPVSLWEEHIGGLQAYIEELRSSGIADLDAYFTDNPQEVFKCVGLVKILSVNKRTLDLYEAPDEAALLRDLSQVFTEQSFEVFRGILTALASGARMYECETVNKTLKGRKIDVLLRWSLISGGKSDRDRALVSIADITERKRAEEALREREKQLAESQRIAHIGSWEHNLKTDGVLWSEELFRLFDLDPTTDPADIRMFFEMVHPEDLPVLKKAIDDTLRDNTPFSVDYRLAGREGETRILHAQAELLCDDAGDPVILSGTVQDITGRKMQEQALAESEANYRGLFDSSTDGIFILDLDGNFIDANRTAYERLGYTRKEMLAMNISQMDYPSFAEHVPERLRQIREHGVVVFESGHLRKDGSMMPVEVNSRLLEYKGKQVFFSVIRDITERKRAEEKLRLSEERFRTLADAAFEAIVITEEGIFLDANRQFCDMVGYNLDELRGKPVMEVIAPEDRELVRHNQSIGYEAPYENRLMRKDGLIILAESRARHYKIQDRKVRVTVIRDITERKRAEEDMLKAQKLESLGILAGGIAHDFNNILTAILGNISLARMNMKPDEPQFARLEEAERASYHARELTQQLLTFAKGGTPVKKTLSVEQLVRDAAGFAVRGSNVRCDFSFGKCLWPVDVDEGQMGQVFNNLVINACQAMPEGGIIRINARNVDIGLTDGMPPPRGRYVEISIRDQGTGISGEHLQRIFDPYFTTKQKGSGLGLSIVYSVLKNHNAYITVKSDLGAGTTFFIYLPASAEEVAEKESEAEVHGVGRGRVLLMDDEEIVRKIAGDILQEMGYEVEFAADGAEAITLYGTAKASSRPFDAIIMDLTVPGGMGGKEAAQKILEIDPEARAIVSSGYSQDPVMANYREYGFCEVIAKPFSSIELGRIMCKVIDGRQNG